MLELQSIKEFLRIDTDADDKLLQSFSIAAEEYLKESCGEKVNLVSQRATLVQQMLISDWYENRSLYSKGNYSQTINSILMQLRLEAEDDN